MSYILGTSSLDWSKVARLESKQLFIVKTQDGSVYKGTLNTAEAEAGRPVRIEVVETPEKQASGSTGRRSWTWPRRPTSSGSDSTVM